MKKKLLLMRKGLIWLLTSAILLFTCFFAYPALNSEQVRESKPHAGILRLWHIDNFEGGIGSRGSFLVRCARDFEKENCFILMTEHTQESAEQALKDGNIPDLISFGTYFGEIAQYAQPLKDYRFEAAQMNGQTYAVPWCRGSYFLFSADGDFQDMTESNTVISVGKNALADGCAYFSGMIGDFEHKTSLQAYVSFMKGDYTYMLGTQRNLYRFATRNFEVQAKPLNEFCDLIQYICITARETTAYEAGVQFVEYLLSESVQKTLDEIGMLSMYTADIYGTETAMSLAEKECPKKMVNAFLAGEAKETIFEVARNAVSGDKISAKNFENLFQ